MSSIFEGFLSTPEALEAFGERSFLQAMLDVEAALARAQARAGLIPEAAATAIAAACKVELFDTAAIVRDSAVAGTLAVPLVQSLKETVARSSKEAAGFVHLGATSQDVIDTALVLVTRRVLRLIEANVYKAATALLALAQQHAGAPVLARTLMQPASVTSFGLKCAGWAAPLVRSLQRIDVASGRALRLQLGGAVGTLAQMKGKGPEVVGLMAAALALQAPDAAWHTQRDEWLALGCELGLLAGSLGKVAKDIALMGQYEVGEVAEPSGAGRGGSSAMPHKRNPVACMVALAAAQRAPQRVAALLAAMPQEHERALGNWQAELAEWPGLLAAVHGSAHAMAEALAGLQVNTPRMRANIDTLRAELPADAADEWFSMALAAQAGELAQAQINNQLAALGALKR
ncbi:3-carboxy-cis,cis-muconate cycloisomerase [Polaromonas sp.]|uniref:3-carboxy-cis,cis-muconate cycloisomerase n=1 Tax=Polaromonas sp. TaxID=1869339 RepID=UPI003568DEB8